MTIFNRRFFSSIFLLALAALALLGCHRSKVKPPYSPQEALQTFRLPPGFRIELVAAEPDVINPVAMAFDERGRLFVVEMPDYPFGKQNGRIKRLEDRDGDGRFETVTVFAQDLHFPNGVMPWKGGVLVSMAPDILYLADRDGDDRADVRQVVLTGFAALNPQVRMNGLLYGIDNWIYAAYPKFGLPSRYIKEFGDLGQPLRFPDHPEVPPVDVFGKGMDFRFRPDWLKLEPVAGNSQFGNAFDAWGHRFTVWNNNHVRHVVLQNQYLMRNPYLAGESAMQSISDHGAAATVYQITHQPMHMHESEIGHFTSACGISVYEGGAFPAEYREAFFVCEPVHNLVHCDRLSPSGATFVARRAADQTEFLASTDSWFRPVFTTVGPDGALYVADFYRKVVEHPEWIPPDMMNDADLYAGTDRGRIYRIVYGPPKPAPKARLAQAPASELVSQLSNPNMWWRITAQRLLVERQDRSAVPALQNLARQSASVEGRVHALWTLDGLGSLDVNLVRTSLADDRPEVREQAVRLAERYLSDDGVRSKLLGMTEDPDVRVQFQLACTLGLLPAKESFPVLEQMAFRHLEDPWFQLAALTGAADNAGQWFRTLTGRPDFTAQSSKAKEQFLRRVASILGARARGDELTETLAIIARARGASAVWWQTASLDGLASRLKRGSENRAQLPAPAQALVLKLLESDSPKLRQSAMAVATNVAWTDSPSLRALVRKAADVAGRDRAPLGERVEAVNRLSLDPTRATLPLLERLLTPQQPEAIQTAAARAVLTLRAPQGMAYLLDRWQSLTGPAREVVLAGFLTERRRVPALVEAIAAGKIPPSALSPARRTQLIKFPDEAVRERARSLLNGVAGDDRKKSLDKYRPAARMAGQAERGREIFKRTCSKCHRIGGVGYEVGPDLASITNRTREDLLTQIIDPNAYITPGYDEYIVETTDGRVINGVMAKETATSITLRRSEGEEDTILRSQIAGLRSSGVSMMPENLESGLTVQGMADLLEFLKTQGKNGAAARAE